MWRQKRDARRNAKDWPASRRRYAFPRIGDKLVSEVTSADLLQVLTPLWHAKPETARRVRQRIGAVMKWAVAMELRPDNPAGEALGQALGRQQGWSGTVRRSATTRRGRQSRSSGPRGHGPGPSSPFEFLVLTAARSAEVRLATWSEVDRDSAVWAIPCTRMKTRREHRVPLCGRAIEILDEAARLRGDGSAPAAADLLFPSPRAKALSDMTLSKLVKEQGIAAVPHGHRSCPVRQRPEPSDIPHK